MKRILTTAIAIIVMACSPIGEGTPNHYSQKTEWKISETQYGKASWYGVRCNGGTHTASGERLSDWSNTAAHKSLPFGTLVKVTNLKNGKSETVKINNRGPYIKGRIIDVTVGVAEKLGFKKNGIAQVKLEILKK